MNPKECKGKTVIHTFSNTTFTVTGGIKKSGKWYLKDNQSNVYLFDECQLVDVDYLGADVCKLKGLNSCVELSNFFQEAGKERFDKAWIELEREPVEAAAVSVLYCSNWTEFCELTDAYGVSQEKSPEFNRQFRQQLKERNLTGLVAQWYEQNQAKEEAV